MRPIEPIIFLSGLLGALASGTCLAILFILLLHERGRVFLTYSSAAGLRGAMITLLSALGGILLGVGGNCSFYTGIVPCLRGHNQDPSRTIMYWLHRYILSPLGLHPDQSGWESGMDALGYLPIVLEGLFFLAGVLLARRWLVRSYRLEPIDWAPYCPYCLYNLTGNVSGVCPECGAVVPGRGSVKAEG